MCCADYNKVEKVKKKKNYVASVIGIILLWNIYYKWYLCVVFARRGTDGDRGRVVTDEVIGDGVLYAETGRSAAAEACVPPHGRGRKEVMVVVVTANAVTSQYYTSIMYLVYVLYSYTAPRRRTDRSREYKTYSLYHNNG